MAEAKVKFKADAFELKPDEHECKTEYEYKTPDDVPKMDVLYGVGKAMPLHVQVAKALGWTELHESTNLTGLIRWVGVEPHAGLRLEVPRYDTSWCSTGPLLDSFGLSVTKLQDDFDDQPHAEAHYQHDVLTEGRTPCEAIARLIVELHREGKLTK